MDTILKLIINTLPDKIYNR